MTQHHAELLACNAGGDQKSSFSSIQAHAKATQHPIPQDATVTS